ncbi:DUF7286 family protein [Natrarchaeobius chitinivorans]|uniref:Uncharacterized protein n=1 Tax=Natrarchaeobius chitinivorans TaxID=1679083 RepID=A0A3N6MKQ0_NATCH|nr:hypothetical protein [Natrarchaeobius chitinivorans]RQG96541.1 hypothetical protein EA473_05360 [Natrarchaeobius chitinivorans]
MKRTSESRPSTVSVTLDERGRIPFAIIGVLLLVTSVTSVAVLQSRVPPEPAVDASLAMDRTSATAQTVVRNAAANAAEQSAREPLMDPNESHSWGQAIAATDSNDPPRWIGEMPGEYQDGRHDVDPDHAFGRYLKLRIYNAVERDLHHLDGEFRGDTTTNVSLPPLEENRSSAVDAIDRVKLDPGIDSENDLEPGQLEVTIEDVEITVERNGQRVAHRVEDVTVVVGTNVFVLHQKTREYEHQLNMNVVEGGLGDPTSLNGFGQHFAARIYPLTWARGLAQWGGAPISEVMANRHTEVMANDAAFDMQESTFGTADPNQEAVMRNAWGCLAAQDAEELYEGQTGDEPVVTDAEDFCAGLEYLYGDQNANLAEPIDTREVMESTANAAGEGAGIDAEQTIDVDPFADLAYAQTLAEMEMTDSIEDVHRVESQADLETGTDRQSLPSGSRPALTDSSNWTRTTDELRTDSDVSAVFEEGDPDTGEAVTSYSSATVVVTQEHTRDLAWSYDGPEDVNSPVTVTRTSSSTYETEIDVRASHPDRSAIEYRGIENGYDESAADEWPHSLPDGYFEDDGGWETKLAENVTLDNYAAFPDESTEALLGVDPHGDVEAQLERQVTNAEDIRSERDLRNRLSVADGDRTTHEADTSTELITAAIALDLYYIRAQLQHETDTVTFENGDLLTGDPFGELNEEIDDQLVYHRVPDRYPTVADKARVEARQTYVDNVKGQIGMASDANGKVQDELDDRLGDELDAGDDVLEGLSDFSREVAGGDTEYEPATVDSPYSDEMEYTPAGSPTYLSLEQVEAEEVPATGNATHTPLAARNNNWFAIPYNEMELGVIGDILSWLFESDDSALTLRMAGELLEAARLADVLLEEEDEKLVDNEQAYEDLEEAVDEEINDLALETTRELNKLEHGIDLDEDRTEYLVDEGIDEIGDGTPGQQAAMLGSGEGVDYVERHVREEIDVDNHGENPYDNGEVFKQHAGASVNYALTEAVNQTTVDGFETTNVDYLNESVRDELEERSEEVVAQRMNETIDEADLEHDWLRNNESGLLDEDGDFNLSPNRVPAGLPIVPLPKGWVATTNVWDVEVKGEYARFELESNTGTPSTVQGENYVREEGRVTLGGDHVGSTRPIAFESRTIVIVVVPPQRLGVGDRTGGWAEESEGWPETGSDR